MVFSSIIFMFRYLPIILLVYFITPKRFKNLILFLASLIFYAWGEPVYVVLMLFSTVVDYTHGRLVAYYKEKGDKNKSKVFVVSSVIINLLLLGFFKYSDFLIININNVFDTAIPLLNLPLPIGISFYTFQTMSYTIDIYRGEGKVQRNIIDFGAYVTLFPQLIAGPIVKYKDTDELLNSRDENFDKFYSGVVRFITGLAKKVLLANNIGILWDVISKSNISEISVVSAWIGIFAFAFQIYFDFSGYSDMAIGLGRIFGFEYLENFNYPYISTSITDFWKRWHISLSSWFRDYVYIPLGGNRKGKAKLVRNILIVWCLTGIWHGSSWNFLMWGLYFAILLLLEKFVLVNVLKKLPIWIRRIYAMFFVLISWVIFAFDSFKSGLNYLGAMFGLNDGIFIDQTAKFDLLNYGILFVILFVTATPIATRTYNKISNKLIEQKVGYKTAGLTLISNLYLVVLLMISIAYLVDASYNPFLYFRF